MSRIANRPLTKPQDPYRFADLAQVLAGILLLMGPAFLYASQRAELHRAERSIGMLQQRLLDLQHERDLLNLELATQEDPWRLEARAREIAGLQAGTPTQMVHLPRIARLPSSQPLVADFPAGDGHP